MTNSNYTKQVIIMRRKYPDGNGGTRKVRTGKMVAQGAHASMAVLLNSMSKHVYEVDDMVNEEVYGMVNMPKEWHDWINGKFTKVTVYVDTEDELLALEVEANKHGLPCALIKDSGLTEFDGKETYTALAIGPEMSDKIDPVTSHLPLL